METGRMTSRITFYALTSGQTDDGDVVGGCRKDVYKCWAEVLRTSIKDFKAEGSSYAGNGTDNGQLPLMSHKDEKVFIIRYHRNLEFDNAMYIDFNGLSYKITAIEVDYAFKETILVKGVRVS